jgi:hypothetical protein
MYVLPTLCHWVCFVIDMVILYFLAMTYWWCAIVCNSYSDLAIKMWSFAYSIVFTNLLLFSCMLFIPLF